MSSHRVEKVLRGRGVIFPLSLKVRPSDLCVSEIIHVSIQRTTIDSRPHMGGKRSLVSSLSRQWKNLVRDGQTHGREGMGERGRGREKLLSCFCPLPFPGSLVLKMSSQRRHTPAACTCMLSLLGLLPCLPRGTWGRSSFSTFRKSIAHLRR